MTRNHLCTDKSLLVLEHILYSFLYCCLENQKMYSLDLLIQASIICNGFTKEVSLKKSANLHPLGNLYSLKASFLEFGVDSHVIIAQWFSYSYESKILFFYFVGTGKGEFTLPVGENLLYIDECFFCNFKSVMFFIHCILTFLNYFINLFFPTSGNLYFCTSTSFHHFLNGQEEGVYHIFYVEVVVVERFENKILPCCQIYLYKYT
ncbi:Protein of unknown function [Gryllus bimaculatus]|nr:Protein of unknown function [Gryllus bimaculatus]